MNEQNLTAYVDDYLDNLNSGTDVENSVHSLIDVGTEATPLLLQRYPTIKKKSVKEALLEVLIDAFQSISSESIRADVINLFGKEILSAELGIWNLALDGLSLAPEKSSSTLLSQALDQAVKAKNKKKEKYIQEVLADRN